MLVIARSTERELARQVSYLKSENQLLRSRLPGRISLTQREKNRLVRFAKYLGSAALNELAAENGWGYCRILGELRKLGVRSITRNTVKAILKRNGTIKIAKDVKYQTYAFPDTKETRELLRSLRTGEVQTITIIEAST